MTEEYTNKEKLKTAQQLYEESKDTSGYLKYFKQYVSKDKFISIRYIKKTLPKDFEQGSLSDLIEKLLESGISVVDKELRRKARAREVQQEMKMRSRKHFNF